MSDLALLSCLEAKRREKYEECFNDKQMHFKYQQRNLCDFEVTKNNNIEVVKNFNSDRQNLIFLQHDRSIEKSNWRYSTNFTKQEMLHLEVHSK